MEFDTQLKKSLLAKKTVDKTIAYYADEISEIWNKYHKESCD